MSLEDKMAQLLRALDAKPPPSGVALSVDIRHAAPQSTELLPNDDGDDEEFAVVEVVSGPKSEASSGELDDTAKYIMSEYSKAAQLIGARKPSTGDQPSRDVQSSWAALLDDIDGMTADLDASAAGRSPVLGAPAGVLMSYVHPDGTRTSVTWQESTGEVCAIHVSDGDRAT